MTTHDRLNPALFELSMSKEAQPLMDAVKAHIDEHVDPITEEFFALNKEKEDRWSWHPRQLELLEQSMDYRDPIDFVTV